MPPIPKPTPTSRAARVIRMIEEGHQEDLFSPRVVAHQPWANAIAKAGPKGLIKPARGGFRPTDPDKAGKQTLATLKKAFPDVKFHVDDAIESASEVVVRWTMTGTHRGAILGVAACNQEVEITGINIYRFAGDRIVESWGQLDLGTLARQSAAACAKAIATVSLPAEVVG